MPDFQCLYLAQDKDTALQETLGQEPIKNCKLTPQELALSNPQSETIVSVTGQLDQVIDLRKSKSLKKLTAIFKTFKLSKELIRLAKEIYTEEPQLVKNEKTFMDSIMEKNWREKPVHFDIPSNSQILGYLVYSAGIDGIIYPSKMTGKDCLAIFPRNFEKGDS
ncbi:MAG: RES domain-containing protein [Pseudobdellovibrionaceae bacterium]